MNKILLVLLGLLTAQASPAQETVTITGRIVRATTGEGFAGVRLSSPNLKVSAMTDDEGRYTIQLPSTDVPLVIEAPGCERQEVALQGRTQVNVTLLDELGRGSYDTDLTLQISNQLHAIRQSGQPGSGATYFVRGLHSLNLPVQPLFVIDGVVWQMQEEAQTSILGCTNSPLNLIDPADVERVEVLRDGSAVWGSKAAGGVVLITTKRARDMVTRIEANLSVGFQTPMQGLPVMSAQSYRRYATDIMRGLPEGERQRLQFSQDDPAKSYYWDTHQQTNWLDEVNEVGLMQRYGINVAGGDDVALYRFSLGYGRNDGNIHGTAFGRMNVRFNSDINLTEQLKLSADIAYAQTSTDIHPDGLATSSSAAYTLSPYLLALQKSPLYGPYQHNLIGDVTNRLSDADELGISNPVALTGSNLPQADKYRFNIRLQPTYSFTPALRLTALLGFSWDKVNEDAFFPDRGVADQPLFNAQGEVYGVGLNQVSNLMGRQSTLSAEGRLEWDVLQTWQHELHLVAAGRFYNDYYKWNSGLGYNTGSDFMRALSNTNADLRWLDGNNRRDRDAAWLLTASYSFTNKYFVDLGLELATSSRYGSEASGLRLAGVSWSLNPSLQASWLISSERWMKPLRGINTARLRVGLSQTGNDRLPLMSNRTYLRSTAVLQDAPGLYLAGLGNEQLRWETTHHASVGMDLSMLNHRLQVSADIFWARTTDLIIRQQLRDVAGLHDYYDNDGTLTNRGLEVSTAARIIDGRDWKLTLGACLGHYINKVRALDNGAFTTELAGATLLTTEGRAAGVFYGWQTAGVFSTAAEAAEENLRVRQANGSELVFGAGDVRFVDQDGNGLIDERDRICIGDPNPDIYGDLSVGLRWRRLTLDAQLIFNLGADAYNAMRQQLESGATLLNQTTALENRWTADGQKTDIPRATYGDPLGNSRASDRWVEDASFLKLRRVQLAYDIPVRSSFLQGLSVWAAANNLFTLTRYMGADPEFSVTTSVLGQGVDCGLVPASRNFQLGVKINL